MDSWFNTPERIAALEAAAKSWVGTPFVANSRIKGPRGGVSCQMLAEQLYLESGLAIPFTAPSAPMRWSETHRDSLIERFLNSQTQLFQSLEVPNPQSPISNPQSPIAPGDIVGFKIGGCVHHLGTALERGRFIHAMRGIGTQIYNLNDPTYEKRISKIWRPFP
jgi:cell wall-associated NlpC family hydrolase